MFNMTIFSDPEETKTWRSAHEIEIAALKHEERWIQLVDQTPASDEPQAKTAVTRKPGFLASIKTSLQLLAGMFS
jgi:hypothetical protein